MNQPHLQLDRLRLHPPEHDEENHLKLIDAEEYSPTSPAHSGYAPTSPTGLMAPPLIEQGETGVTTASHNDHIGRTHTSATCHLPASPGSRRSRSQPPSPSVAEPGAEPTGADTSCTTRDTQSWIQPLQHCMNLLMLSPFKRDAIASIGRRP